MPVDYRLVLVGRHPQCDARLDSDWVSLRHCVLTEDRGEVVVRDLGSTNGTWINGRRVKQGRLKPGDEMTIAHGRYRLEGTPSHEATVPILRDRPAACIREMGVGIGAGHREIPGNSGPVA
jgi:predicted component of type VI protein secretion system